MRLGKMAHPTAGGGPADDRSTAIAPAAAAAVTEAAPAFADADAQSGAFRPLAWSEAHDVPPLVAPAEVLYEPEPAHAENGLSGARPLLEFADTDVPLAAEPAPRHRRGSALVGVAASVALLLATGAVVAFASSASQAPTQTAAAPSSTQPPVTLTIPRLPLIPGLLNPAGKH